MRLNSISLASYGNFEAVRLALDPCPGHINLVLAPNGGGKTVLRRAFRDLLFGIPGQTEMAFRFGYAGMRLFAEGLDGDGAPFAFGRRKGIGNTLVDAAGNSLDPGMLKRLIGDADEKLFGRLFALDTELLRGGADAMLASGGDLAEALFAAGSGIADIRRLREEFETAREELAPGRKKGSCLFYQAVDALTKARSDLRDSTIRPQDWRELSSKLDFIRERRGSLAAKQAEDQTAIERLQRIKRVRPWLEQLEGARLQCAASASAPRLPDDIEERWRESRQAVALAEREFDAATDRLQDLTASLAVEQPDRKLLVEGERIDDLIRARDHVAADHRDLPRREAERAQTAARLDELLSALDAKSADEIAAIVPNGPRIAAARDLIKRHEVVSESLRKAHDEVKKNDSEIAAAEAALGQIGESDDVADLTALTVEARAYGEPARRLTELNEQLCQQETRLAAALAKVPLWGHGLEALAAVVPPTRNVIDCASTSLDSVRAALAEAERDLNRRRGEHDSATRRLVRAQEGKSFPDAAAVAAARDHRDRGWSLIRRSKFEGEVLEAEIEAYSGSLRSGSLGLATVFERAIDKADDLADRRHEESQRLAAIAEQQRTIAELATEIADAKERLAEARKAHDEVVHGWAAVVVPLGFAEAPDPGDVRDFITAREAVLDARAARDLAQQAVLAEMERREAARRRFAKLLPADKCASLDEALATAQQVIERCTEIKKRRDQLQDRLDTFHRLHRQALDEQDAARQAVAQWQDAWRECLSGLNRPPSEPPAAVERAIQLNEEAHSERRQLGKVDHRITGMRRNIADFEAEIADLVTAVAPDLIGQPAEISVRELRHRLATNREKEAQRLLLLKQEKDAREKLTEAENGLRRAKATSDARQREIGGDSTEEVLSRIALAAQHRDAQLKLSDAERNLAELGDGWPIGVLEREVAAVPADTIEPELARLQDDARRIADEREAAAGKEQRLRNELQGIEAGENAIDAEERRQAAIASATRISAEALVYHAAECLLRRGIDRLRNSGDNALVQKIGAVFTRITGGAYAGVDVDEDDKGTPFLIAIEAGGITTKRVAELSDGNRDQLFLALRQVMLEDYVEKAPALPFIADDLLQTFDDYGRTTNALAALTDLSHYVQVIVLSHHRQLVELARALPGDTVNVCDLAA